MRDLIERAKTRRPEPETTQSDFMPLIMAIKEAAVIQGLVGNTRAQVCQI
jgi:hypothetical protein